jgi:flagellar basal body rod protein FlgC
MIAISTAQYGMLAAQRRFAESAERVARMNVDLTHEVVDQALARPDFAASARVLKAADQMSRKALDLLA